MKSKKGGVEIISTLSPEQQGLIRSLAPYLQSRIGQGLPAYTGKFVAELSPYEEAALSRLGEYLKSEPTAGVAGVGLGTYADLLRTGTPQAAEQWWQQYRRPQWERILTEEVLPAVKEARVASGTLYGTPYSTMAQEAISEWGRQALADIGSEIVRREQLAASLLPYLRGMREIEAGVPQIEAGMKYGELPRLLEQAELTAKYEEFKRTTPELSPILDLARDLLNIQTQTALYRPSQQSAFMQILPSMMEAGGKVASAMILASALSSDIRLKRNIRKIGEINGLGVYEWEWKEGTEHIVGNSPTVGFIAQEVAEKMPEAVVVGSDGYLRVDYSKFNF